MVRIDQQGQRVRKVTNYQLYEEVTDGQNQNDVHLQRMIFAEQILDGHLGAVSWFWNKSEQWKFRIE
jgi:hypothetical protein